MMSLKRRGFLRYVVGASIALPELGCSRLTRDNLFKLKKGMTTSEVEAILGRPTSITSPVPIAAPNASSGYPFVTKDKDAKTLWKYEEGGRAREGGVEFWIWFDDKGKLLDKAMSGLRVH